MAAAVAPPRGESSRELDGDSPRASSSTAHSLDLPSLLPLSHEHALLASQKFDVDAFLLSRIHIPLDELRAELRSYLGELREELVQLINDDYEEFISLGTGLRGESERLRGLQKPLTDLCGEVETVRDVLKGHQDAVQAKLDERAALREERALLELLQRLFETLTRAESLEAAGDEDRPKTVQRLANEYTQLVYLRNKAATEGCKVADTVSPRIDALRTRLKADLMSLLTAALRSGEESQLKSCLKTYDVVEAWGEAEEVVRVSVRDWCRRTITATSLVSPPSPTAPETPSVTRGEKHRLPPGNGNLGQLYNRVLSQVKRYAPLLSIGKAVSAQFNFFAGVLWPEICKAIIDNVGSTIFAAGRPDELHKHYTTTHQFLGLLETMAPTPESVITMRESDAYETFERRWQLPVYFQLRWKEIVTAFEVALESSSATAPAPWALSQSSAAWDAFSRCWSPEIYLPELSHRFWRLSLQIVSRYSGWLSQTLSTFSEEQEDAALRFAASAIADVDRLRDKIRSLPTLTAMDVPFPLGVSTAAFEKRIVAVLSKRCNEGVKMVRSWAPQFRAAPPKPTPTASPFVAMIFKPLNSFLNAHPSLVSYKTTLATEVAAEVFSSYATQLAAVRKTEDLLRRHRKTKKSGFSLFGASTAAAGDGADEDERFRKQMRCDIDALAADAKRLGVEVEQLAGWGELVDVVARAADA